MTRSFSPSNWITRWHLRFRLPPPACANSSGLPARYPDHQSPGRLISGNLVHDFVTSMDEACHSRRQDMTGAVDYVFENSLNDVEDLQ